MQSDSRPRPAKTGGFTLVELLVVIGIIGILISLLMPALSRARQHANSVKCQSNLHQVAAALLMYSNTYRGWLYPVGQKDPLTSLPRTLGLEPGIPREKRWPSLVFDPPVWNPPVLLCPSDFEPAEEHSYVLNKHLAGRGVRFGRSRVGQLDSTQVVVTGEKVSGRGDYYMSRGNVRDGAMASQIGLTPQQVTHLRDSHSQGKGEFPDAERLRGLWSNYEGTSEPKAKQAAELKLIRALDEITRRLEGPATQSGGERAGARQAGAQAGTVAAVRQRGRGVIGLRGLTQRAGRPVCGRTFPIRKPRSKIRNRNARRPT